MPKKKSKPTEEPEEVVVLKRKIQFMRVAGGGRAQRAHAYFDREYHQASMTIEEFKAWMIIGWRHVLREEKPLLRDAKPRPTPG
jgi:hypothetical protein